MIILFTISDIKMCYSENPKRKCFNSKTNKNCHEYFEYLNKLGFSLKFIFLILKY